MTINEQTTSETTPQNAAPKPAEDSSPSDAASQGEAAPAPESAGAPKTDPPAEAAPADIESEPEAPSEPAPPPGKGADAPPPIETPVAEEGEVVEEFDPAKDMPMFREGMNWFVLRVASNKENYVRETLMRKVQIEGMEHLVGRIMVPTTKTKTLKGNKQVIVETKLYPGYVFVEMRLEPDGRIPQDVFFLIKETTGVGDFVGTAGRPTPLAPHEVEKMLFDSRRPEETPTVKMEFAQGDNVTIKDGPFENYEGTVDEVLPDKGKVRVLVTIFGRQAPVELQYWQIQKAG